MAKTVSQPASRKLRRRDNVREPAALERGSGQVFPINSVRIRKRRTAAPESGQFNCDCHAGTPARNRVPDGDGANRSSIGRVVDGVVDAFASIFHRTLFFTAGECQSERSKERDDQGSEFNVFHLFFSFLLSVMVRLFEPSSERLLRITLRCPVRQVRKQGRLSGGGRNARNGYE